MSDNFTALGLAKCNSVSILILIAREWRERRELAIQRRDEQSKARKQETLDAAKQNIDDFYDNYNDKKDKAIAQTRCVYHP